MCLKGVSTEVDLWRLVPAAPASALSSAKISETLRVPREHYGSLRHTHPFAQRPDLSPLSQFALASDIQFSVCHHLGKFEVGLDL